MQTSSRPRCQRCRGPLWRDQDDENGKPTYSCLQCGDLVFSVRSLENIYLVEPLPSAMPPLRLQPQRKGKPSLFSVMDVKRIKRQLEDNTIPEVAKLNSCGLSTIEKIANGNYYPTHEQ